jgi:NOL1/NOP2/fmu family ribosome biogenesis protein
MAAAPEDLNSVLMLSHDSPEILAFLRGEELAAPGLPAGYAGVAVDGVTVGFGKCSGGRLKNHYPKGLRNHF